MTSYFRSAVVLVGSATVFISSQSGRAQDDSAAARESVREVGDRLVVHEWGTFTSLHDEQGRAIGGINSDDEPVPPFVHRIANFLLLGPNANIPILVQGAPRCHPDVTMRLETPVVYFYPPRGAKLPIDLDVEVAFPSGWLSEYYPDAEVEAPGVKGHLAFGPMTRETVGRLRWKNLQLGTAASGPETTSKVWLEPRQVRAADVTSASGNSERFLFYRGVAHVDSPVRASRDSSGESLIITADFPTLEPSRNETVVQKMWLVEVRGDRSTAFREIEGFLVPSDGRPHEVARTNAAFVDTEFPRGRLEELMSTMRAALIDDGLFDDEADALLNTWKISYFETPGLRLFFVLPRAWTDHVLPLKLSSDASIVRTMIGRVEIVTPHERQRLREIAAGPASKPSRPAQFTEPKAAHEPADFRAYRQLGRFRNALLLNELARRATPALQEFVTNYGLQGYQVVGAEQKSATN